MAQASRQAQKSPRVAQKSPRVQQAENTKKISYSNGATYDGHVNNMNQRHGKGTLNFPNGEAIYEGLFKSGNMTKGKISYLQTGGECWFNGTFVNGQWGTGDYKKGLAIYSGTFENQAMNGQYQVKWQSGAEYVGTITNNKLHGEGEMKFDNGNIKIIKGQWNKDVLEQCWLLTMRDGSTATNYQPSTGKLVGQGQVKVGGSLYDGVWDDNGRLNGKGTIQNDNNMGSFKGAFKDNVREGDGTYIWPNGQGQYKGMFAQGKRHTGDNGPDGTMVWGTGDNAHTYIGKWAEGKCTKGKLDGNEVDAAQ